MKIKVLLNTVQKIEAFVKAANSVRYDIDLVSGKYYLDAKSILGILSCNVYEPMTMIINTDNEEEFAALHEIFAAFIV